MRRLVYRVQPLPHSMLPLVWDFGQLNVDVEEMYIRQMVLRKVFDLSLSYNYMYIWNRCNQKCFFFVYMKPKKPIFSYNKYDKLVTLLLPRYIYLRYRIFSRTTKQSWILLIYLFIFIWIHNGYLFFFSIWIMNFSVGGIQNNDYFKRLWCFLNINNCHKLLYFISN